MMFSNNLFKKIPLNESLKFKSNLYQMKKHKSPLETVLLTLIPFTEEYWLFARNPGKYFYLLEKRASISRNSAKQIIKQARKTGYLQEVEKEGQKFLSLTSCGQMKVIKYLAESKVKEWDGKWRILFFDIPEKNRMKREVLRKKLKELGFQRYQLSAWISPYDFTDEIQLLINHLDIAPYVHYLISVAISGEDQLKEMFDLE